MSLGDYGALDWMLYGHLSMESRQRYTVNNIVICKYFQITELDIGLNFDCNIKLHKKGFIYDN